jgi:ribosomal protein L16 Arg81 hydroxylase
LREQLDQLIGPLGADRFFADHWAKCPVFIEGADDKFSHICDPEMWRTMQHATELDAAQVDERGVQTQFRVKPAQIESLYQSGHTICANVSRDPAILPLLVRFGRDMGMAGGLPFAKLYASPDGGGFTLHLDTFHVFVLQLSGSKRWQFSRQPVVDVPLHPGKLDAGGRPVWGGARDGEPMTRDDGALVEVPNLSDFDEATLTPGDLLYLPPGSWHLPHAVGHSVGLSISPPRAPVYHLVARVLEDLLLQQAAWRRDVPPDAMEQTFAARVTDLRAELAKLDQRALQRVWRINRAALGQQAALAEPAPTETVPLRSDDVLTHLGDEVQRYLVAPTLGGPDEIFFYAGGAEWSLPIEALTFVKALAATERFVVDDARSWDEALSSEDVKEILGQLLAAGMLRRE